ncbi:MAG: CAP domain-containing protein, partial [Crocinitomicaceae bacterium]
IPTHLLSQDNSNLEKEIFNKINNYRVKIGKSKFIYNDSLVKSCRSHSNSMGINYKLEHVKNLNEVGANAEIIQLNYTNGRNIIETSTDVLDIFLDSPSHKKIIEGSYKQISIGVYVSEDEDLWVTIRLI